MMIRRMMIMMTMENEYDDDEDNLTWWSPTVAPQFPHSPVHIDIGQNYDGSIGYQSHHGASNNDRNDESNNYQNHHGASSNDQNDNDSVDYQSKPVTPNPLQSHRTQQNTQLRSWTLTVDSDLAQPHI